MTGGLACNAQGTPDMTVAVTAGKAYVTVTPTSQGSQRIRANIATQNATIAANASGGTRYDWIYVAMSASGAAAPAVDGTGVASITVSRSTSSTVDNGTPPTYGYNIAVVTVANGAATITNGNITDKRTAVAVTNNLVNTGWISTTAPNTVTANGNRSYDLTFNSVDLTDTLSPGMRLKLSRTTSAPTQCTSLNGTTQYYNKTSPNKLTFTDDFVVSAWIKVSSYSQAGIVSRFNGTSGWAFRLDSNGRVTLVGYNAGAANFRYVTSYQSVPLNKWVHVTAQLDMSTYTATTTTCYVMIDGVNTSAFVSQGGTNPTTLIQAGNLEIGTINAANFFPGKIAQVAIYNAKVTQATILASMHQTLTGSETSLASAYSFNNSIADLNTTTPNDLTAQGSAVATNSDSPFALSSSDVPTGSTEYAIIMKSVFSTDTTLTVQVPEGNAIPTSGGISAMSYSTHRCPYGFLADKNRYSIGLLIIAPTTGGAVSAGTWYSASGLFITVPVGKWARSIDCFTTLTGSTTAEKDIQVAVSESSTTPVLGDLMGYYYTNYGTIVNNQFYSRDKYNVSAATNNYIMFRPGGTGTLSSLLLGDSSYRKLNRLTYECEYV